MEKKGSQSPMEPVEAPPSDQHIIARMRKNAMEEIVFSLREYKGRRLADIRVFTEAEGYAGPTKKGVCFGVDLLEEFSVCLGQLQAASGGKEVGK
jgi:hypothetical protein